MSVLVGWLQSVDWHQVGEGLAVAGVAFVSAVGGARAAVKRLGTLLSKVLVADLATSLKPAVLRTLRAWLSADSEARQAESDKVLVAAVRSAIAEMTAELREDLPGVVRDAVHAELREVQTRMDDLDRRLGRVEGAMQVLKLASAK